MKHHPIWGNLPNILTLARILAVPLLVWLVLNSHFISAFWVFLAAGVSDALDGYIAKRYDLVTVLGSYLDPIADKALLVAAYVTLGHAGYVDVWLVILVVFRDVFIIGGAILFNTLGRPIKMQPLMISKLNTLVQIMFIAAVLAEFGFGVPGSGILTVFAFVVAGTTICSGMAYMFRWVFGVQMPANWRTSVSEKRRSVSRRRTPIEERL